MYTREADKQRLILLSTQAQLALYSVPFLAEL